MTDSYEFLLASSLIADNHVTPFGGVSTPNDCDWEANAVDQSAGYNLVEFPGSCTLTAAATDVTGVDPGAAPVRDNGCAETLPDGRCAPSVAFLSDTSSAIDVGSCVATAVTEDTRGFGRPFDVIGAVDLDDACDIGAFEFGESDGGDNDPPPDDPPPPVSGLERKDDR